MGVELSTDLKQCELQILKAFIEVCEKLNLRYYMVEGSLLGAVRHQGFIPWDDDIDVALPRLDYERFLREAQGYLPEYYFVQSTHSELSYHANYAKIRDCRTTFIEKSVKKRNINHGVYIDVFPLDFAPHNQYVRRLILFANIFCSTRIAQVFYLEPQKKSVSRRVLGEMARVVSNICFPKLNQAIKAQRWLYTICVQSELVTNYGSVWGEREVVPSNWYGEGKYLEFEGLQVRVPSEYDKILTQIYGNYMTPPPVEKRVGHHATEVIDLDKSYTQYIG